MPWDAMQPCRAEEPRRGIRSHRHEGDVEGPSDRSDLDGFADALRRVLTDSALPRRLGANGRSRMLTNFLDDRHLVDYAEMLSLVCATTKTATPS